jgi:hypothetical protein
MKTMARGAFAGSPERGRSNGLSWRRPRRLASAAPPRLLEALASWRAAHVESWPELRIYDPAPARIDLSAPALLLLFAGVAA